MVGSRLVLALVLPPLALMAGPCDSPDPPAPVCSGQGIETSRDVRYREGSTVALDLYAPVLDEGCEPIPVVVYVHGGGFVTGDKANRIADKVDLFTGEGWAFASVDYGLAPGSVFPEPERDLAAAVSWLRDHADEFGGDPDRIALSGHSAGAYLVTIVASDLGFLEDAGVPGGAVRCAVSLDTDDFDLPAAMAAGGQPALVLQAHVGTDPAVWGEASPLHRVQGGDDALPSFLLVTRGTLARRLSNATFADAVVDAGTTAEVVDARPLTHEQVNEAVGQDGDTIVTPPLLAHLRSCL